MNMLSPASAELSENHKLELELELEYYDQLHREKYRDENQTKEGHIQILANNLGTDYTHRSKLYNSLKNNRFLPAGRIQAALGATEREVSPFNCSVSQRIEDSMDSIMDAVKNAAKILRLGTGIGYNFSNLRPRGAEIKKLKTQSSGPLSFMKIFDVMASTIASSGHRRGAQMGIINCDHPNVEEFIEAKMVKDAYRQFNFSVGITDLFMEAVKEDKQWLLSFKGEYNREISARQLWEKITRCAYESAEPGILFIDRWNSENNLFYCEHIEACNPCSEQCLPPYGLCTLGSFNLMGYVYPCSSGFLFNEKLFIQDIHYWVEAYDNIFDNAVYAIPEHKIEALNKRRIGLGFTGIANAIEMLTGRASYGEPEFCNILEDFCRTLRDEAYSASAELAKKRGAFSLFDERYLQGKFIRTLPDEVQSKISNYGIRNSHIISYAPCGTISQTALNISSGVEPVFHYEMSRDVYMKQGKINVTLNDYNFRQYKFRGKTLNDCSVDDHMRVASTVQRYCDSAISKTVNVSSNCSYEDYAKIYIDAHKLGLKGITVYRPSELRGIVIAPKKETYQEAPSNCVNRACSL